MKNKKLLLYGIYGMLLVVILLVAGVVLLITLDRPTTTQEINSFDDCAKAGYPILESYPRQCKTPDGRTFTEEELSHVPPGSQISEKEYCDAENPCSEGKELKECYKFQDEDKPICWEGNPCEKCESKKCIIAESYPAQVFCQ